MNTIIQFIYTRHTHIAHLANDNMEHGTQNIDDVLKRRRLSTYASACLEKSHKIKSIKYCE